ncbi:MAG: OST-HTH/LOTUS domain-containing protein, partial [Proteobacteria bacterium]|nr:OST-HTH/LOTUS domain-containing protein [Pseudomonadota bacterium]
VLLLPEVIDRRMCRELIDLWQTKGHDEGPVGSMAGGAEVERVYHSIKKRLDHAIMDTDINRTLQRTIGRRLAPEMAKAFYTETLRFDRFLVVCYDAERGDRAKLWGSMIKQTLKRRRPGFNESFYGFSSFSDLLEEAQTRGQLELEMDERSGGYVILRVPRR